MTIKSLLKGNQKKILFLMLFGALVLTGCQNTTAGISAVPPGSTGIAVTPTPGVNVVPQFSDAKITSPDLTKSIKSPMTIHGEITRNFIFEGTFPIVLKDNNGAEIVKTNANAESTDMTQAMIPFSATLNFNQPTTTNGTLVIQNDNPSGLPANDDSRIFNVTFEQKSTSQTSAQIGLLTYSNQEYKFQFNYPPEFSSTNSNYANLDKKIVQFGLPSSAFPKTNFSDAGFSVSVAPAKTLDQCLAMNPPEGNKGFNSSEIINGISFSEADGSGAGAGNLYESKIYRTFADSLCFEIAETIHTSNINNFDPGTVTEVNKDVILNKLRSILLTFKFN